MIQEPFNYSGFASLRGLESNVGRGLFRELEDFHKVFSTRFDKYRSSEYVWPKAPLHTWSRVWEYPYGLYHLRKLKENLKTNENPTIVDLGSGVTFFPFFLAHEGFKVIATDIDHICEKDFKKAIEVMCISSERIDFVLCKEDRIPINDHSISCVYSISVIEHVKNIAQVIKEVHRVLKPDGVFILTFDVALNEGHDLSPQNFETLLSQFDKFFEFWVPLKMTHPLDLLCSTNGPFPLYPEKTIAKEILYYGKEFAKKILGKKRTFPLHFACIGFVLRKKGICCESTKSSETFASN